MDTIAVFLNNLFNSGFSGDIKVIIATLGFWALGWTAIKSQADSIKERAFEIILLSVLCPTIMIIATQKEARHDIYAGLLGTLIGYFFNVAKNIRSSGSSDKDNENRMASAASESNKEQI